MTTMLIDEWHGAVRARLNAPDRRNPLTLAGVDRLLATLRDDPGRTVVIGSTVPAVFSAGADLAADNATRSRISDQLYACYHEMVTRPGLVFAVVEGLAVGGGAQLSTAADLRITGVGARWKWVGLQHALAVGGWILPFIVGRHRALEWTLTSRWVSADEAALAGLAPVAVADPWGETAGFVQAAAALDPAAVARLKALATHPELVAALARERDGNRAWGGAVGGSCGART